MYIDWDIYHLPSFPTDSCVSERDFDYAPLLQKLIRISYPITVLCMNYIVVQFGGGELKHFIFQLNPFHGDKTGYSNFYSLFCLFSGSAFVFVAIAQQSEKISKCCWNMWGLCKESCEHVTKNKLHFSYSCLLNSSS